MKSCQCNPNVADKDAVNVSQLKKLTIKKKAEANKTTIDTNKTAIANAGDIATNKTNIATNKDSIAAEIRKLLTIKLQ